jgi:hypothetical protein
MRHTALLSTLAAALSLAGCGESSQQDAAKAKSEAAAALKKSAAPH